MVKVNIKMLDETFLSEVFLFKNKDMGESVVRTKEGVRVIFMTQKDRTVWYSGKYTQGWIIPSQIESYEIIEDTEEVKVKLNEFIKKNSGIWDLNDTSEFIMYHREELLRILR